MSREEDLEPLIGKSEGNSTSHASSSKKDDDKEEVPSVGYHKLVS